ncbi:MAG: hypothetical protein KDD06_00060 [Phaeodactylibacter sp.]|nr:hypothetical protein [Phaeodactylibacter sp.]MCB9288925.1 hypothetical protein [Lewinellaceae bacterium]
MPLSKIIKLSWLICIIVMGLTPASLKAQDEEEQEQLRTRASLSSVQKNDNVLDLKMLIRAKIDGRYTGLPGLEVMFYATTDSSQVELGKAATNEDGIATLTVKTQEVPKDTANLMAFAAEFEGNDEFKGSDDDIEIYPAELLLQPIDEDSSRALLLTLVGNGDPVEDEDISIFVKRLFAPLKVGEGTTDSAGEVDIDFPMDLPGDGEGNLEIFARLEDHSDYGTVEVHAALPWGTPVAQLNQDLPKALWSPNPPTWMLLAFIVLMTAVWGHYAVIVYKLAQVKKEGNAE